MKLSKQSPHPIDTVEGHPEFYWSVCLGMTTYTDVIKSVTVKGKFKSEIDILSSIGRELVSEDKYVYLWNF